MAAENFLDRVFPESALGVAAGYQDASLWDEAPSGIAPRNDRADDTTRRLALALEMAAHGFRVFPLLPGSKEPPKGVAGVTRATTDAATIRAWFAADPAMNYGVAAGAGLIVVDVDAAKGGLEALKTLGLPETFTVKTPGGGLHLYLTGPDVAQSVDRIAPGVDIRSGGGYVVGPGSYFADPGGKKGYAGPYEIAANLPAAVAPESLILRCGQPRERSDAPPAAEQDAPADLARARDWLANAPPAVEGQGGDAATYKVACVLRDMGLTEPTALDLMREHWNARCSPPWDDAGLAAKVANAFTYGQNPPAVKSMEALAAGFGDTVTVDTPQPAPLFDPWRDFIVPDVPAGILPPTIERFAIGQGRVMGACTNALAMAALAALSGAVDHRMSLRLMRHGGWRGSPRLWTLLAGPPSSKKTPIINAALAPLEHLQARRRRAWEAECARVPDGQPKPPEPERFIAGDTTSEALAAILARQDRGVLVKRDEIAGWIGGMEKYASGRASMADRAFWLEAFNGSPFMVDRVGRGTISVANLSVSIIGGIQPDRLAELQGLQSDGLLQRFVPVFVGPGRVADDRPVPPDGFAAMVEQAASVAPMEFTFDNKALAVMERFRQRTHDLQGAAETALPGFAQFVGKLDGLFGTFALLFHVADGLEPDGWMADRVPAETAARVERLFADFIMPHAFEFYGFAEHVAGTDRLRKIGSWVLTRNGGRFTAGEAMANVACLRGLSTFDIGRALGPLVAGGWLEPEAAGPENRAWRVSAAVAVQFAKRREDEERRKQELARLMNGPRRAKD
ncbi:MAG: DUF3987 domain-containing protein [Phreatobacter sp.]|uniref:DUF3987 domain-containing protein n=1 Tax=Phreatobacter sp. TaxID=1966341 RepID=UPI002732A3DE|nr:DUF3987 domain-containing protein [Phreatobacter sp.]MDP2800814.1 DUF3987 domain-containing protein [Phreatobacter sp.]